MNTDFITLHLWSTIVNPLFLHDYCILHVYLSCGYSVDIFMDDVNVARISLIVNIFWVLLMARERLTFPEHLFDFSYLHALPEYRWFALFYIVHVVFFMSITLSI